MIPVADLTSDLLAALVDWQTTGRRSVEIKIKPESYNRLADEPEGSTVSIWAYDYDYMDGAHITKPDDLPTKESMIKNKQAKIEEDRRRLMKQLEELEVTK